MNKAARNLIILIVLIAVVLAGGYWLFKRANLLPGGLVKDSGTNISDYSAVFLTNGQVYFGKISSSTSSEVDINDIFYLQVSPTQGSTTTKDSTADTSNPDISLVKLGNELHGPNDRMHINKDQVLFTESLKSDSKVVKAIEDFKNK